MNPAPRKLSPYGVMSGVRVRSTVDRSILGLSSRLPEIATGFWWGLDLLNSRDPARGSKVEAAVGRYKRLIGDALRSREDARRLCEVKIAAKVLNRMLEIG